MSEEEIRKDILFQIDMQLYDEFNDTVATMYDHLGDVYFLRDIEEVEKSEKDKEIKLLRKAISNLQKELDKKDKVIDLMAKSWKQDDIRSVKKIKQYFYKKVEEENDTKNK